MWKIIKINKMTATASFILLRPNGEILMQLRDDGLGKKIKYPDAWCFPGGEMEENESYLECVLREVKEEHDIPLKENQCELLTSYDHEDAKDDHVYICQVPMECAPRLGEGRGIQWMDLKRIKKLDLAWDQVQILPALEDYLAKEK